MQRYVVFAGHDYECAGGWWDRHSYHDNRGLAECVALDAIYKEGNKWAHVVDLEQGTIIKSYPISTIIKEEIPEVLDQLIDGGLRNA